MKSCLLGVLLLLSALGAGRGRAAGIPADEVLPLGGLWKGKLALLGGQLDVTISVVPLSNGTFFAALDVPAQKVSRLETELTVRGDSVLMRMPGADSRYFAHFDRAKRELNGTWTQGREKSTVRLYYFPMPTVTGPGTRLTPPYREEEVFFNNPMGRLNLAGTLTVPPGKGPFPAVVLVSDVGAQDREGTVNDYHLMGSLADYLTRRGIAVLVSDVQAALNFLRSQLAININRIGVIGHGEGANVALLAAAKPLPPAFVVSLAGYGLTGEQTLLQQLVDEQRAQKIDPAKVQAAYERQRTMFEIMRQTGAPQAQAIVANMLRQDQPDLDAKAAQAQATQLLTPWRHFFLSFDPIAELDEVRCPVLLLSGTNDLQAPADLHLTALEKELKSVNRNITSKRLAGVNHLFQPPKTEWTLMNGEMLPLFSPVALETIREWIVGLGVKK
jgi:fermentation-respiration switch protein FrsA (DUF1100 family)